MGGGPPPPPPPPGGGGGGGGGGAGGGGAGGAGGPPPPPAPPPAPAPADADDTRNQHHPYRTDVPEQPSDGAQAAAQPFPGAGPPILPKGLPRGIHGAGPGVAHGRHAGAADSARIATPDNALRIEAVPAQARAPPVDVQAPGRPEPPPVDVDEA